ncbi:cytochrome P450 [Fomitiporia mediterranea MF3/22]|uniref:cytochrome P450 n=1 Tax=Fomitiporia mediterranea (strain MF3/22) TaxID=694068 RepID=UPI00044095A9|nr:cytochrome P450 [Fomitiporia mediterranea MF3/22]EJC99766.1 cytochrome P450 [Fomitiporia mediterranea MF3/22]
MDVVSAAVLGGVLAILVVSLSLASGRRSDLPSGPKGDFIVGNLGVLLSKYQWMKFSEWSKTFGDIMYLTVLGRPIVVLNKLEHARELMEKRSAIYSDRPRMDYIVEMVKVRSVTFMPYGDTWRLHRRLLQQYLNPRAVLAFRPLQTRLVRDLVQDLYLEPDAFWRHIKRFAASAVLSATYGYQVERRDDPLMKLNEFSENAVARAGPPGTTLVDLFPILQHAPSFLPGLSFKDYALEARVALKEMLDRPYETVKQQRDTGTATPCLLTHMLDDYEQQGADDKQRAEAIKEVCGSMYRAGVGTTSAVLYTFMLAMVLYPRVARKAQDDLDAVLRGERLPTFDDQDSLPYITCIAKECLRWGTPFPLGISHRAIEEGELEGKYIPKGSMIIPNVWQMMHDERNYNNPMEFNPDRFIAKTDDTFLSSVPDPALAVFGFGRRICPGRHFAEADIWLAIASILTVFDIRPAVDDKGSEILPKPEFTSGLNSWPMEFMCRIIPRNKKAAVLARNARE